MIFSALLQAVWTEKSCRPGLESIWQKDGAEEYERSIGPPIQMDFGIGIHRKGITAIRRWSRQRTTGKPTRVIGYIPEGLQPMAGGFVPNANEVTERWRR